MPDEPVVTALPADHVKKIAKQLASVHSKDIQGDRGPVGSVGPVGEKGLKGDKGDTGDVGAKGPKGDKGDTGDKGDKGMTGPSGSSGPVGPEGKRGETGAIGRPGNEGPPGPQGNEGNQGRQGPSGVQGQKGEPGQDGVAGSNIGVRARCTKSFTVMGGPDRIQIHFDVHDGKDTGGHHSVITDNEIFQVAFTGVHLIGATCIGADEIKIVVTSEKESSVIAVGRDSCSTTYPFRSHDEITVEVRCDKDTGIHPVGKASPMFFLQNVSKSG
jgi:hypothetical protein